MPATTTSSPAKQLRGIDLTQDVNHCGECDKPCEPDNVDSATVACTNSVCEFECGPGFGDCDEIPENGCEIRLLSSDEHCGECEDSACGSDEACRDGVCVDQ